VSQISPPFRIAVVAMLAVCALWFTVLRPKPAAEAPQPAAPGTTGLAGDVAAANGAAAASGAANARVQSAAGGAATKSASQPATKTATSGARAAVAGKAATAVSAAAQPRRAAPADLSTPLLRALDRDRAVVLVFWNRRGADDKAVRSAAEAVDRRHGRVLVQVAPISSVGRYAAITRGVQILEAPTALVLAPSREARVIAGFTSTPELDQAAADALAKVKSGK
jgi:hypothetical protein